MSESQSGMLTTRELLLILWNGKWLMLALALAGLTWGLVITPLGHSQLTGTVRLQALNLAPGQAMSEVNWLEVYLASAGFPTTGRAPAGAPYTIATSQSGFLVTMVFSGPSDARDVISGAIDKLAAAEILASEAYLNQVRARLVTLSRMQIAPGGLSLVFLETVGLQSFVDTAEPPLFRAHSTAIKEVSTSTAAGYVRHALLGLAAGIIAVLSLYLLRLLVTRPQDATRPTH